MFRHAIVYTQENGYRAIVFSGGLKQIPQMQGNACTLEARYEEMFGVYVISFVDHEEKGLYPDKVKIVDILETAEKNAQKVALDFLLKRLTRKRCYGAYFWHEKKGMSLK